MTTGPIQAEGHVRVTFVYYHRVHDGLTIGHALNEFEEILGTVIAEELGEHPPK